MKSFTIALAAVVALSTSAFAAEPYARNDGAVREATVARELAAKVAKGDAKAEGHATNNNGGNGRSN